MKGSEAKIIDFLEGAGKRFVIPVYQRKYDWREEHCRQLYEDLKRIIRENREGHFFGSIVSSVVGNGAVTEYHIIDGQQRLTTVTLLLLAICRLIQSRKVTTKDYSLENQIYTRFLVNQWAREDDKIKLRPIKEDREALAKLFGDKEDFDPVANLTLNYRLFCSLLEKEEVSVDELFNAIGKLEIISITLEEKDNAQLIFESLNSTGLALSEGDKIRNFVLMGQPPREQEFLYSNFWTTIERCTRGDVSSFVRDYLSIKQQITPNINNVYRAFKEYVLRTQHPIAGILEDLQRYARFYEKLLSCKSGINNRMLDDCLYRMSRLEIAVTRPFFMEVFRLNQDGKLSGEDVSQIFLITENYLFRRNICDVPTSALNKIFLNLNREILRFDNTAENYVSKFIYALTNKKESGRFPSDAEFSSALAVKQVYMMRGKYKAYLFERLENYGTIESKDVYTHLDNSVYTIEHIMPQHLTPTWMDELGANAVEIHQTWLHRLANLTLSGYNPSLSNKSFIEKRNHEVGGYRASGLRMNQKLSNKEKWGIDELEERNEELLVLAKKIWSYPESDFMPMAREFDSYSLDDENADLTGRNIVKYSYQNTEQPVTSWVDMFEHVIMFLHSKDRSILFAQAHHPSSQLTHYVSNEASMLNRALKIDDGIYVEVNTNTDQKMAILRRLFAMFDADPMDLVFYLRDEEQERKAEDNRDKVRRRYWTYALPIIRKQYSDSKMFSKCSPVSSNTLTCNVGKRGIGICCVANRNSARIDFYLGHADTGRNKKVFDILYLNKNKIERELGVSLIWKRADECKASWLSFALPNVSINNESDWPRMAKFHAEWSKKICSVVIPYIPAEEDYSARLETLAEIFREWASDREYVNLHASRSIRRYTRFTTDAMSSIIPDIPNAPSAWGTDNHYFYEVVNITGKEAFIKLVINAQNANEEFLAICERINEFYPAPFSKKKNWLWRQVFRSSTIEIADNFSKEDIFNQRDTCLKEIQTYEADLQHKLSDT